MVLIEISDMKMSRGNASLSIKLHHMIPFDIPELHVFFSLNTEDMLDSSIRQLANLVFTLRKAT